MNSIASFLTILARQFAKLFLKYLAKVGEVREPNFIEDVTCVDGLKEMSVLEIMSVTGTDMNKWKTSTFYQLAKLKSEAKNIRR